MANINIRDFPDDLHKKVKSQAALEGLSIKALVIKLLTQYVEKPANKPTKKKGG